MPATSIPTTQLNPIAHNYLQFYPAPNLAVPVRPDDYQNFGNSATTNDDYNNQLGRLDYNMSDRAASTSTSGATGYSQVKNNYFENVADGSVLYRNNWGGSLDEVYTINSTNVLDIRAQLHAHGREAHASPSTGFDPTALGFPSYMAANSLYLQMPVISFNSNTNFQNLSSSRQQQSALAILPALRHLDQDQGQPHSEGRRRRPPVPPEYLHRRQFHRHLQLLRQ